MRIYPKSTGRPVRQSGDSEFLPMGIYLTKIDNIDCRQAFHDSIGIAVMLQDDDLMI